MSPRCVEDGEAGLVSSPPVSAVTEVLSLKHKTTDPQKNQILAQGLSLSARVTSQTWVQLTPISVALHQHRVYPRDTQPLAGAAIK